MKLVFVVNRLEIGGTMGTPMPVMGVHTQEREANAHVDSIILDRVQHGGTVTFDRIIPRTGTGHYQRECRDALIDFSDSHTEHIWVSVFDISAKKGA